MTVYTLIVGLLGLLGLLTVTAWSPHQYPTAPTNTHEQHSVRVVSRKGFFQEAAGAALVSTAVVSGIGVEGAQAASASTSTSTSTNANFNNVYEPPRGSQNGRVIIITGASSGLGLESAKRLAAAGATTILTARTTQKGTQAVSEVQQYLKERSVDNSNVYSVTLNLDDFESVKSFATISADSPPQTNRRLDEQRGCCGHSYPRSHPGWFRTDIPNQPSGTLLLLDSPTFTISKSTTGSQRH